MDINLIEIGGTIIVGAYFIVGTLLTFHILFHTNWMEGVRDLSNGVVGFSSPVLISMCFGMGILVENMNSHVSFDGNRGVIETIGLLPSEKKHGRQYL